MLPALNVLLSLATQIHGASTALQAVAELIEKARREGREVTLDELKSLSLDAHEAVDSLRAAIEEAE